MREGKLGDHLSLHQDCPSVGMERGHSAPLPCDSLCRYSSDPEQSSHGASCGQGAVSLSRFPEESQHLRSLSPTLLSTEEKGLAQKHTMTVAEPRPIPPLDSQEKWQEGMVSINHCPWPPDGEEKDTIALPGRAAQSALAFSRETKALDSPSSRPPGVKPGFEVLIGPNPHHCCFRGKGHCREGERWGGQEEGAGDGRPGCSHTAPLR